MSYYCRSVVSLNFCLSLSPSLSLSVFAMSLSIVDIFCCPHSRRHGVNLGRADTIELRNRKIGIWNREVTLLLHYASGESNDLWADIQRRSNERQVYLTNYSTVQLDWNYTYAISVIKAALSLFSIFFISIVDSIGTWWALYTKSEIGLRCGG